MVVEMNEITFRTVEAIWRLREKIFVDLTPNYNDKVSVKGGRKI